MKQGALPEKLAEVHGKKPVHQEVYSALREHILFGDYAPGQPLTIQFLCDDLGAGMTPVREALRRLIAQGALAFHGNRRVSVPLLSRGDIEQLMFMRIALEPELARRATETIDAAGLAVLRERDTQLNAAIAGGDVAAYLRHNYRFHTTLYGFANAPAIAETTDRLWLRFGPSLRVVCGKIGTMNLPDKHADLLCALGRRDADAAAAAMEEDVRQGMEGIAAHADSGHAIDTG